MKENLCLQTKRPVPAWLRGHAMAAFVAQVSSYMVYSTHPPTNMQHACIEQQETLQRCRL